MTGTIGRSALLLGTLLALNPGLPGDAQARQTAHKSKAVAPKAAAVDRSAGPGEEGAAKEAAVKPDPRERVPFTQAEAAEARPEGLPGRLRIAGDDAPAFQALIDAAPAAGEPWLVLSGGGENGAYAAGILNGWSRAGDRPSFGVVTGVSTGALIAPFAFVGPVADPALKQSYTETSAADVFEFGNTEAALTDTWPLRERIEKTVTPDLLRAVAAEHAKGRRLLVATTQVETERPVLWDMGALATIAAGGGDADGKEAGGDGSARATRLFREVILASTAVPGVFPPVMIGAVAGKDEGKDAGKRIREMHDDGGAMSPFFLAPAVAIEGSAGLRLPTRQVYLVVNNRLAPEFGLVPRTVLGVLTGTMTAAIKAQTSAALALTKAFAIRTGLDLRVAEIDGRFTQSAPGPFDARYMKALYEHGEALGRAGTAFRTTQPPAPAPGKVGDSARASEASEAGER